MQDLSTLTHDQFGACLNQVFIIGNGGDGKPLETVLVEVQPRGSAAADANQRQPFSVVFRGPMTPLLPQGIHKLDNTTFGELTIFLVAIGPDDKGMRYEAIFS